MRVCAFRGLYFGYIGLLAGSARLLFVGTMSMVCIFAVFLSCVGFEMCPGGRGLVVPRG